MKTLLKNITTVLAAGSLLGFSAAAQGGELSVLSRIGKDQGTGGGGSYAPQFSADGNLLLFVSHARNLSTNSPGGFALNLYSMHLTNAKVTLVSAAPDGRLANGWVGFASTSSNGQYIVLESDAQNFGFQDTNSSSDVFIRDMLNGSSTLVSAGTNGGAGKGESKNAVMTPDGRWIAFESRAKDLAAVGMNTPKNVFLWDRLNGIIRAVTGDSLTYSGESYSPAVTPDGRKVAFVSTESSFVPGAYNPLGNIYIRDMQGGAPVFQSVGHNYTNTIPSPYRCFAPQVSDTGNQVLFKAYSPGDGLTYLCFRDLVNSAASVLSTSTESITAPILSSDGKLALSESNSNVFLWNLETGTNLLISVNASGKGPGNGRSYGPVVSRDFTRVAFVSEATDLTTNVCNGRAQVFVRDLALSVTRLVSMDTNRAGSGDLVGVAPAISPSGDLVAFDAVESNLAPNDQNQAADVFLYSWASDTLQLVTRAVPERPNTTGFGVSLAGPASVSANGRYMTFGTTATNIYPGFDTNAFDFLVWDTWQNRNVVLDIFTNRPSGTTTGYLDTGIGAKPPVISEDGSTLVYVKQIYGFYGYVDFGSLFYLDLNTGVQAALDQTRNYGYSSHIDINPAVSADGRYVVFQSDVTTLSAPIADTNNQTDVFIYDAVAGTTNLLSVSEHGNTVGSGRTTNPWITPDGKWAFFQSTASNLSTNLPASYTAGRQIQYARDLTAGKTYALGAIGIDYTSAGYPVLDASNRVVFFDAANLCCNPRPMMVLGFDLLTRSNIFVGNNCANPSVSGDGRYLVYQKRGGAIISDVYVRDLQSGVESLVTIGVDGTTNSNGRCTNVVISADGRFVVFASTASNLVPGDDNGVSDIFVRDRVLGVTTLLSVNREGTGPGSGASFQPVMSRDGRTVVFQSFAGDLAEGDYNNFRDVFVARLGGVDSDSDGLDDDWEVAFFGDLSRTGTGDFDGDGQTDTQEFLAGTDPKDDGSILRVMTVSGVNSGVVTILWNAVPGRTYRVQYKDDLSASEWSELGAVVATSGSGAKQDTQGAPQRFYRVVTGGE